MLEYDEIFCPETDYRVNLTALLKQLLCNGICYGTAHAAAYDRHLLQSFGFGSLAQRSYEVVQALAFIEAIELLCSRSDNLIDYRDRAFFSIVIRNCKRYSFSVGIHSEYYELSGLCLFCYQRSVYLHQCHCRIKALFF